jgi:uncharacterized protein (TIGR03437 family)
MTRHVCFAKVLSAFILLGLPTTLLRAQSTIQVVNAASYAPSNTFAPGTIVSILGANLTNTVQAAPNSATPPTSLGGVSVTIGGIPAGLFFVSPGQINAHIDPTVPTGSVPVIVTSPTGSFSTTITISYNAAAGLFSIAGTGTAEGAILNAITFALGPFTVTSPTGAASPGGPTFLAIYLTGLNLSASPQVAIGGVQVPVFYFGNAPCCAGLEQINVQLVPQLAGAGQVPVVVTAAGVTSNVVKVTILPNPGQTPTTPQSIPMLSGVVVIPGTKLGLVSNATNSVVEVINTSNGTVANSISLPQGAAPGDIAVNSGGTLAVVVEHGQNAVAFLNLQTFKLLGQANVGHGPVAVTIVGNHAFVVNQDSDSVTVIDLQSFVALSTIAVGHAPSSISVDMSRNRVLVTNSGSGTISAIDLTSLQVTSTVPLSLSSRPLSIRVVSADDLAVITDASLKPGQVMVVDLLSNTSQIISVGGTQIGSWNVAAVLDAKAFLTDPVDGEVGIVTFSRDASKQIAFQTQILNVQPGVETLDVDSTQNILIIIQSNGQVLLYNLTTNTTVASVDISS